MNQHLSFRIGSAGLRSRTGIPDRHRRRLVPAVAALVMVCALCAQAGGQSEKPDAKAASPSFAPVQTATTHPMKYLISLPRNWSADRQWPVLVTPSAHYDPRGKSIEQFARERDTRQSRFIVVAPFVINADSVLSMQEYRGVVMDSISAADAAVTDGRRDEVARAKFDSEGVLAVIKDVQKLYRGEEKVYLTGFSSSTHIVYMFLFAHPEVLKGVIINSGVYLGRGVDEDHIPLMKSPVRARLDVKYIVGEKDPGYPKYMENWLESKKQLLDYGHTASKLQMEIIKAGNSEHLSAGHNWYVTRIFDFCDAVEKSLTK